MNTNGNGHVHAHGNDHSARGNDYKVPQPRKDWIVKRKEEAARTGDWNMSQMHFARKGLITEEMAYVAHKEKLEAEFIRAEIARGTDDSPGQHQPSGVGADGDRRRFAVQDQCEHRQLGAVVERG